MKKYKWYIGFILVTLLVSACKKDDIDPTAEAWKQQNEQALSDLARNPEFNALKMQGGYNFNIYYRIIQQGEGKRIYYNSRAEVYYKGWFVVTNADKNIKEGDVFDHQVFDDGVTFKLAVSSQAMDANYVYSTVIEGWGIALQNMVEGDKWEIWIPYRLGYGEVDKTDNNGIVTIPAYSTLAFEIEVVKAIDPDEF